MTMLAVGPLWVAVHILANIFFPVPVGTDVAVLRNRGGGTQCTRDFWRGKNPSKQSSVWIFTSLCVLSTLALMWHIFYMYNSFKKSTDWQLESNLLFLIWALVCILLQLWLGGTGTLPLAMLEALNGVSYTLMWPGSIEQSSSLCSSHLAKVQMGWT